MTDDTITAPSLADGALATALLVAAPDGILLVDASGRIVLANPAAAGILGRSTEQLRGLRIEQLIPPEFRERHVHHRESFAADPQARPMGSGLPLVALHADGALIDVEISLSPVRVDGVDYVIAAVRDVSDRRQDQSKLAMLEDRQRIARDLHDLVIQRLFAAGMSLQAVAPHASPSHVAETIAETVDELDLTIREIRSAIFALGHDHAGRPLSVQLEALVDERSNQLGFTPGYSVDGDVDSLDDTIADQLLATVIEGLSNVARHAQATAAHVHITCDESTLELTISDNGVGLPNAPKRRGGLANIMWRAAELGGVCAVERPDDGGTTLRWRVPVD